jgi:hypothetical protein
VKDDHISFNVNGTTIGEWKIADASVRQQSDGYHITAGLDSLVSSTTQTGSVTAVTTGGGETNDRIRAAARAPANAQSGDPRSSRAERPTSGTSWMSWARLILLVAFLFPFMTVTCLVTTTVQPTT